jgi:general secretion pathway protein K
LYLQRREVLVMRGFFSRLRQRLRRPIVGRKRQAGIALIMVAVTTAVLGAVVGDFSYNARVDLEAAANGRDQLRAEYLARSGIQLARLLIKVQQSVLDRNRQFIGDIQISDFAPYLVKAFGGSSDEAAGIGALLGLDFSQLKGLGVGKNASFDVAIDSEDGKLNVNCGGGFATEQPKQAQLFAVLTSLFFPTRYNRMFEKPDAEGQYWTRDDVARAIIDWADADAQRYDPTGASSGAEDYRYDAQRDPYRAHDHLYDTVEEMNLVRGVGDEFWGSFGEMLTVYGGCKVNVGAITTERWPLMAAILRATVKDDHKSDPLLLDDLLLAQLSQTIIGMAKMTGGFQTTKQFIDLVSDPAKALGMLPGGSSSSSSSSSGTPQAGVPLDPNKLNNVITVGPRRVYRIDATGTIQRTLQKKIQVHIRAVWDTQHFNQNSTSGDMNDRMGTWVYWRED